MGFFEMIQERKKRAFEQRQEKLQTLRKERKEAEAVREQKNAISREKSRLWSARTEGIRKGFASAGVVIGKATKGVSKLGGTKKVSFGSQVKSNLERNSRGSSSNIFTQGSMGGQSSIYHSSSGGSNIYTMSSSSPVKQKQKSKTIKITFNE